MITKQDKVTILRDLVASPRCEDRDIVKGNDLLWANILQRQFLIDKFYPGDRYPKSFVSSIKC